MSEDFYKLTPATECLPIPPDLRRAVLQTAYTRDAKREHLENILRRYDRMLDRAEQCLIRAQSLAKHAPSAGPTVGVSMRLILDDVSKVLDEDLMTFHRIP
jgi:hypothetical protein